MTNRRISGMVENNNLADGDLVEHTDISDTSGSAAGTSKRASLLTVFNYLATKFGTAAAADTGPALDQVPTGQVLQDGITAADVTGGGILPINLTVALPNSVTPSVLLILNLTSGPLQAVVDLEVHSSNAIGGGNNFGNLAGNIAAIHSSTQGNARIGGRLILQTSDASDPETLRFVQCTFAGENYLGVLLDSTRVPENIHLSGLITRGAGSDIQAVAIADVTGVTSALPTSTFWAGAPGDSIGNAGALRNTNQVLGEATDFSQGSDTQSGDGTTTTFTIAHGLGNTPTSVNITPRTSAAAEKFWRSAVSSTTITLTYAAAPASGTDNLAWDYQAYREA